MAKILNFKKPSPKDRNRGKTLCLHDFHKWAVVSERKFDVRQGRLVTLYRCQRCGKEKKDMKKAEYTKPVLTKHKKLKDVTALIATGELGCTKNF